MKLLVSERDAFSNRIYLSLVNLWERASLIQNVWGEKLDFYSIKKQQQQQIKYVALLSMSSGFYKLALISVERKCTRKVLSTFPFYIWGNWGAEALIK